VDLSNLSNVDKSKPSVETFNIIAEIYEYRLNKYSNTSKNIFNNIENTTNPEKCGLMEVHDNSIIDIDPYGDERSSCDSIENSTTKKNVEYVNKLDIQYFNHIYLNENAKSFINNIVYDNTIINKFINSFTDAYDIMKQYVQKNRVNILDDSIKKENRDELYECGLLYNVTAKQIDRYIIFGDIHGSFHTFFRNLIRLHKFNVINLKQYKVMDNYKLIFLGDVVDRGQYAIEILYIISKFIINNNTNTELRVIFNKGNHEHNSTYKTYGFLNELKNKTNNNYKDLQDEIDNLLSILPTALTVTYKNKRLWLCHGGIPVESDQDTTNIILNSSNNNVQLIKNKLNVREIKWNDFDESSDQTEYSTYLTRLNKIHQTGLIKYMNLYNLDFIIRGHQDDYSNAMIFPNPTDSPADYYGHLYIHKLDNSVNNFITVNNKFSIDKRVHGPIGKVNIEKSKSVLTISTNTDIGRNLYKDSFIVLHFDGSKDRMISFEQDNNILDIRKTNKMDISFISKIPIKVLTYNVIWNLTKINNGMINNRDLNIKNIINELIKYDYDFVAFQEITPDVMEELKNNIPSLKKMTWIRHISGQENMYTLFDPTKYEFLSKQHFNLFNENYELDQQHYDKDIPFIDPNNKKMNGHEKFNKKFNKLNEFQFEPGRPIQFSLFRDKLTNKIILFVNVHGPHNLNKYEYKEAITIVLKDFLNYNKKLVNGVDNSKHILNISRYIIAGDFNLSGMNEIDIGEGIVFNHYNKKNIPNNNPTCCDTVNIVGSFNNVGRYDNIYTNGEYVQNSYNILKPAIPASDHYPVYVEIE
jgi:endonuclease/exonuclease/phosphatase family metal-dependent hydrolase